MPGSEDHESNAAVGEVEFVVAFRVCLPPFEASKTSNVEQSLPPRAGKRYEKRRVDDRSGCDEPIDLIDSHAFDPHLLRRIRTDLCAFSERVAEVEVRWPRGPARVDEECFEGLKRYGDDPLLFLTLASSGPPGRS